MVNDIHIEKKLNSNKLKNHLGFKRLAIAITCLSFVVSYFIVWNSFRASPSVLLTERPLKFDHSVLGVSLISLFISSGISIITLFIIRIIYWIIDGFRLDKQKRG